MEIEGGGWILFVIKVILSFSLISIIFLVVVVKFIFVDVVSYIYFNMVSWKYVMFWFFDNNNIRFVYECVVGLLVNFKVEFENFLMGIFVGLVRDLVGFYRYSLVDGNSRYFMMGFVIIVGFYFFNDCCILEGYSGIDRWVDMWIGVESLNNYVFFDSVVVCGIKCIVGYCYEKMLIWMMV